MTNNVRERDERIISQSQDLEAPSIASVGGQVRIALVFRKNPVIQSIRPVFSYILNKDPSAILYAARPRNEWSFPLDSRTPPAPMPADCRIWRCSDTSR